MAAIVARLDAALDNLPDTPVAAADELDGAWQLLLAGLPTEPEIASTVEITATVTLTPTVSLTPTATLEATPAVTVTATITPSS
jgi:hypothetical protein